jgi:exopolysaccharide biosynthesis polyprenyl glycosylphosphotransferase
MTPPTAIGHAASAHGFRVTTRPASDAELARSFGRSVATRTWPRLRLLVDVVVLYLAAGAALLAESGSASGTSRILAAIFPVAALAVLYGRRRAADDRLQRTALDAAANAMTVIAIATVVTIAIATVIGAPHTVELPLRLGVFSAVYLTIARVMMLAFRRQALRNQNLATPTLIVGAGAVGEHLVKRLEGDTRYGLRPVGFLDANPPTRSDLSSAPMIPLLGTPDDLAEAVQHTGARHVIVAFSSEPDSELLALIRQAQELGVEVSMVPRMFEVVNERATLDHVGGVPVLSLKPTNPRGWRFVVKHGIDRAFALVALIAVAPVIGGLALAVKLTSPGPVLFRQRRVGRDGRTFDVLKFRTMREPAAGARRFKPRRGSAPGGIEGEDRRTPIGRVLRGSSLDELPQLINVLRGDMSIVGPRPERPEFVTLYTDEIEGYRDRHRVKSGITGWAQVNGLRGQTSIADRVEWDNHYIQNWSLGMDFKILALTVAEVLRYRDDA